MTEMPTLIETTRHDARELHKRIRAYVALAETATWADVAAVQEDISALSSKMKTLATDEAVAATASIEAAVRKLEASGKRITDKAVAAAGM